MTSRVERDAASGDLRLQGYSLVGWAIRKALIGLAILFVTISAAAWLLYTAIDQDAEANATPPMIQESLQATDAPRRAGSALRLGE